MRALLQLRLKKLHTLPGYTELPAEFRHTYSEAEALAELKRVAKKVGHSPTTEEFAKHGKFTWGVLVRIYGSWNAALLAARLKGRKNNASSRISELRCMSEVSAVARKLGHYPTCAEFNEHAFR